MTLYELSELFDCPIEASYQPVTGKWEVSMDLEYAKPKHAAGFTAAEAIIELEKHLSGKRVKNIGGTREILFRR